MHFMIKDSLYVLWIETKSWISLKLQMKSSTQINWYVLYLWVWFIIICQSSIPICVCLIPAEAKLLIGHVLWQQPKTSNKSIDQSLVNWACSDLIITEQEVEADFGLSVPACTSTTCHLMMVAQVKRRGRSLICKLAKLFIGIGRYGGTFSHKITLH